MDNTFRVYRKNDEEVEWDIFVKGAQGWWLQEMRAYTNVLNTVERLYHTLIRLKYKVAYGYIKITDTKYLRSCYLVRDDYVVDTNRQFYRESVQTDYVTIKEYEIQDYIQEIIRNEGNVDYFKSMKEEEDKWKEYATGAGITILL